MARIALKCACGWNFFVPGSTMGWESPCPNCGEAVPIPGRKPGQGEAKPPGLVAAERQARQKLVGLLALLVVAITITAFVMLSGGSAPPEDEAPVVDNRNRTTRRPEPAGTRVVGPDRPMIVPDVAPPPAPSDTRAAAEPSPEMKIAEIRSTIRHQVWMQNIGGITSEVLRLRNHRELHENMLLRTRDVETRIEQNVAALSALGDRFSVEPHIQPGDRIVTFASRDLTGLRPGDAAVIMAHWLSTFRANQPVEQVVVLRGNQRVELYMQFPEETKELLTLSREAALAGPGSEPFTADPHYIPLPGEARAPVPGDILKSIEARFAALPGGYRMALAGPERERLEKLLKNKEGSGDDHVFLRTRILEEALPAFERESANFRAKVVELEAKLKETTAVDVVHFKDGRKVQGQVVEETAEHVRVKSRLGSIPIPRAEILRIERGAGAGLEFPERFKAADGKLPGLVKLLDWCTEKNLRLEREYVATLILSTDPLHEASRKALNLRVPATK